VRVPLPLLSEIQIPLRASKGGERLNRFVALFALVQIGERAKRLQARYVESQTNLKGQLEPTPMTGNGFATSRHDVIALRRHLSDHAEVARQIALKAAMAKLDGETASAPGRLIEKFRDASAIAQGGGDPRDSPDDAFRRHMVKAARRSVEDLSQLWRNR
jgi:hypothetical protein